MVGWRGSRERRRGRGEEHSSQASRRLLGEDGEDGEDDCDSDDDEDNADQD